MKVDECNVSMQRWWNAADKKEQKFSERHPYQYHFVKHKFFRIRSAKLRAKRLTAIKNRLLIKLKSAFEP